MIPVNVGKVIFRILRWVGMNVGKDGTIFVNFKKAGRWLYRFKSM